VLEVLLSVKRACLYVALVLGLCLVRPRAMVARLDKDEVCRGLLSVLDPDHVTHLDICRPHGFLFAMSHDFVDCLLICHLVLSEPHGVFHSLSDDSHHQDKGSRCDLADWRPWGDVGNQTDQAHEKEVTVGKSLVLVQDTQRQEVQ